MRTVHSAAAMLCMAVLLRAQTAIPDPAGVLSSFAFARFLGSGKQSIQAMTSDSEGNLYVAGATSSADFPVKNAAQAQIGEAVLMRSADGVTWEKMPFPTFLLVTISPHPSDPQTLFGGAADGIYKSGDGGLTWRKVYAWANPANDDQIYIAVDPGNPRYVYFYAALDVFGEADASTNLFGASADGGETWTPISAPAIPSYIIVGAPALWLDPNGSGTLALGRYLSRDHGNSWTAINPLPSQSPFPSDFIFTVAVPGSTGWIYAQGDGGGNLYLSKDWGNTWMKQPSPIAPGCSCPTVLEDLSFDPNFPNSLWAYDGTGALYSSNDAGATWNVVATPEYVAPETPFVPPLALLGTNCNGGSVLAVGNDGGVIASHDSGARWLPEHLSGVVSLAAGPGCAVYAVKTPATNAFVAELSPSGSIVWSTFLGGSDLDTPIGIALDEEGNIYVGGETASPDFPVTSPRLGPPGTSNAFAAEFDAGGNLLYSVVVGGESRDTVTGFAADSSGEAHLAGFTASSSFPTTPGAFAVNPGENNGFALKLRHDGTVVYSSYLPGFAPITSFALPIVAVAVETSGTALFGGPAGELWRMAANGSGFSAVSVQPGPVYAMASDPQGNIYVAGQLGGSPANVQLLCVSGDSSNLAFLSKLQPDTLQESYQTRIGNCPTQPNALQVSRTEEATLSLLTFSSTLPLMNPLLLASGCTANGVPAMVRFSADGSRTLFSSYLDSCPQAPAIALAPDGSTYTSVTSSYWEPGGSGVAILHIPAPKLDSPSITGAFNAFSGALASATPGMLLTITGARLASESIAPGIDDPDPLPMALGRIQVLFDGSPAEILQVTPDSVICVAPQPPAGEQFVSMEITELSLGSTRTLGIQVPTEPERPRANKTLPVVLPVQNNFGLMTVAFPAVPPAGVVEGNIRNADQTLNTAQNPAAPGSTVTLYATGVIQPGAVGLYWDPAPPSCIAFLMDDCPPIPEVAGNAHLAPGFINAVYAIDFPIPTQAVSGEHVISTQAWPITHGIGVYVK